MLNLVQRIDVLSELGEKILANNYAILGEDIQLAYAKNSWFTIENIHTSLKAIAHQFLNKEILENWVSNYAIKDDCSKTLAIVMAGNIPMVGFHDLLCSFICGYRSMIKCSGKDEVLIPALIKVMNSIEPKSAAYFNKVDRLKDFDAVIATGGNTAGVHFEYYFSKKPHIIRKNRSSVGLLDGSETPEDIKNLGADIFDYFGLGCRSISKVYIPQDFNTDRIFEGIIDYGEHINHNKYKNNYDYNNATLILTNQKFLTNDFLILKEDRNISSRIACLNYERYSDTDTILSQLSEQKDSLQCVSSKEPLKGWKHIPLGHCQKPQINDYADMLDTIEFLIEQY